MEETVQRIENVVLDAHCSRHKTDVLETCRTLGRAGLALRVQERLLIPEQRLRLVRKDLLREARRTPWISVAPNPSPNLLVRLWKGAATPPDPSEPAAYL